jgi:hypothetical protein
VHFFLVFFFRWSSYSLTRRARAVQPPAPLTVPAAHAPLLPEVGEAERLRAQASVQGFARKVPVNGKGWVVFCVRFYFAKKTEISQ